MENTTFIALAQQANLRRQMDVVANNIANMNTTAYKGEEMMFIAHLVRSQGGASALGERISFPRDIATVRNLLEGPMVETGNPFDLAIHGEGYFAVQTEDGERYTRNGRFTLDETGRLINEQRQLVLSEGGQPFTFNSTEVNIRIARDGTVSTENGQIGRIRVVRFENPHDLRIVAGGLYATEQQPQAVEKPQVVQGMLEGSNVNPIREMTRMIEVHRTYESAKRLIDREDERIRKVATELLR
jgi:flagellar basal-body rod protein FlgF